MDTRIQVTIQNLFVLLEDMTYILNNQNIGIYVKYMDRITVGEVANMTSNVFRALHNYVRFLFRFTFRPL